MRLTTAPLTARPAATPRRAPAPARALGREPIEIPSQFTKARGRERVVVWAWRRVGGGRRRRAPLARRAVPEPSARRAPCARLKVGIAPHDAHCSIPAPVGAGPRPGRRRRRATAAAAAGRRPSEPSSPPPQLSPRGNYVLAAVAATETKTTTGVMLPTSAQRAPTSGDVVAVGDGGGDHPLDLKVGDTILYSKFGLGATDVKVGGKEHILIREVDVIGTMPTTAATAADIPSLRPIGDRVLLKVTPAASVTAGGVVLPDSARERPVAGVVVRAGAGKYDEDNKRVPPKVKEGDRVLYFKWAGDAMETPSGDAFVVLHESDILCKA